MVDHPCSRADGSCRRPCNCSTWPEKGAGPKLPNGMTCQGAERVHRSRPVPMAIGTGHSFRHSSEERPHSTTLPRNKGPTSGRPVLGDGASSRTPAAHLFPARQDAAPPNKRHIPTSGGAASSRARPARRSGPSENGYNILENALVTHFFADFSASFLSSSTASPISSPVRGSRRVLLPFCRQHPSDLCGASRMDLYRHHASAREVPVHDLSTTIPRRHRPDPYLHNPSAEDIYFLPFLHLPHSNHKKQRQPPTTIAISKNAQS